MPFLKVVLIAADEELQKSVIDWCSETKYAVTVVQSLGEFTIISPDPLPVIVVAVSDPGRDPQGLARLGEAHPVIAVVSDNLPLSIELELLASGVLECLRKGECTQEQFWAILARARARFSYMGAKDQYAQMFRALCDSMTFQMAYRIVDPPNSKPRFVYVSDGVRHISGLSREDVLNDPEVIYRQIIDADRMRLDEAERIAVATLQPLEIEVQKIDSAGQRRWVHIRSFPTKESDGTIVWDGIESDITNYKRAEEDVTRLLRLNELLLGNERVAREKSEHDGRMREDFLATLSHELRTPINAVLGWTQLIQRGSLSDADYDRAIDTIERNARTQAQMISDLLDMSRIISNTIQLEIASVDLRQVILEVFDTVKPSAKAKEILLIPLINAVPDCVVRGDKTRLHQIFVNILANAIKFTPQGGEIRAEIFRLGSGEISISIKDTGVGIKKMFLPFVFDRFRQADATFARRFGGLGIGLSIVKRLTELHSGEVVVTSPGEGQGTTFTVTLPSHRTERPEARLEALRWSSKKLEDQPLATVKVFLIDDDADSLELARQVLVAAGATVITAQDGFAAIEQLSRDPALCHIIVSDIAMPGMDGIELLRRIRNEIASLRCTPAIAVTAFARTEERACVLSAGFNLHLSKPLHAPDLIHGVKRLVVESGECPI